VIQSLAHRRTGTRALDYDEFGLSAFAVATSDPADKGCLTAGFTALGIAEGGSQNIILDGFCIHGEDGVKFGSQNCMEGGEDADSEVIISMPNPGAGLGNGGHDLGSDNEVVSESMCNDGVYSNNDLPDNVEQQSIANFADNDDFIFDLSYPAGDSGHVDKVTARIDELRTNYASEFPADVTPIFQDDYVISSDSTVSNQLIISNSKITIGSNVSLANVYLLAKENVEFGSNVTIGSPDFCNTKNGKVLILAGEQAKFGSDNNMFGSQVIAGNFVDYGSHNIDMREVSVLSGGDIKFGSGWDIRGCDTNGAHQTVDPGKQLDRISRLVK